MNFRFNFLITLVICASAVCLTPPANSQIYNLAEMNTRQIETLDRQKTVVIIPAGIMEEHGPYLPSFTDGYVTQAFTDSLATAIVARRGWTVVLFPQIPLGSEPANTIGELTVFPGSFPVRTATVRAIYMDLASDLGEQGFRWIFLIQNHGSPNNHRVLDETSDYFHDVYGGTMVNLFGLMPVAECCGVEAKFLSADALAEEGFTVHAGADETSLLYFLKPDLLAPDYRQAASRTSHSIPELLQDAKAKGWPGYFGAPRLASAALGAQIFLQKSAKANETALAILDGADSRKIPRYADVMFPLISGHEQKVLDDERKGEQREQEWLKRHGLE